MIDAKLKAALMDAYQTGWHDGFTDACNAITPALIEGTAKIVADLKETAREVKTEAVDKLEVKNERL